MTTSKNIKLAQQRMEEYTHEFPEDLLNSLAIAENNPLRFDTSIIQNVVICGMGGSGIGGMMANDILTHQLTKPIEFCKGYNLPNYVNSNTLVICSSYSGNTEETIELFQQGLNKEAQIISICSGGELLKLSEENNIQTLIIPSGKQPRAAVGLSLIQQLHILGDLFLNEQKKADLFATLKNTSEQIRGKKDLYQTKAKNIAQDLYDKNIILFTETRFSSIATRFTQQINENVKKKAHAGIIPEMNHNELVAFVDYNKNDAVVFVNSNYFHSQNKKRTVFLQNELKNQNAVIIELNPEGNSEIDIFINTIYLLDLTSIELSIMQNVDPEEVKVIDLLKRFIAY